jgi:hypothetical protein
MASRDEAYLAKHAKRKEEELGGRKSAKKRQTDSWTERRVQIPLLRLRQCERRTTDGYDY